MNTTVSDADLDDPAEAWALIERYANAALPAAWQEVVATLREIESRGLAPGQELPDVMTHEGHLVVLDQRLRVLMAQYHAACTTTRRLLREHWRRWPRWHEEQQRKRTREGESYVDG